MPSDSIAGFLDRAQASRVLHPDQVEQLIRQPDIPHSDLTSLCTYLLARGVLTQYQADAIRNGHGDELIFATYPVIDRIGPCPGGTAYRALHPSLRTPLVLRRLDPGAFGPTDTADGVVTRAPLYGTITHANIQPLLDSGMHNGQPYAVLDTPADVADIASLLKEVGGAMPGFLAAEYGWSIASALRAIHERGGWHGEVCPALLSVGPVLVKAKEDGTLRRRPAPNATVKLAETGLIPIRLPAATALAGGTGWPTADVLPFLPPERIDTNTYEARGDIYGLGAALYLLLTGRSPFPGETLDEIVNKIRTTEPQPLASLRPDVQPELAALVMKMLAKRREDRPQTAFDVCQALVPFCRPGSLPSAPAGPQPVVGGDPNAVPVAVPHVVSGAGTTEVVAELEPDPWGVSPSALADAQAASTADKTQPRRRGLTDAEKARSKIWIAVGLCLHMTAVGLLIAWALGAFSSSPSHDPEPSKDRKTDPPKKGKTKKGSDT